MIKIDGESLEDRHIGQLKEMEMEKEFTARVSPLIPEGIDLNLSFTHYSSDLTTVHIDEPKSMDDTRLVLKKLILEFKGKATKLFNNQGGTFFWSIKCDNSYKLSIILSTPKLDRCTITRTERLMPVYETSCK